MTENHHATPRIQLVNLSSDQLSDEQRAIVDSFTRVYEELNQLATRRANCPNYTVPQELLKEIESALRRRDALEDQHAPIGILVEPIYENGLATELMVTIGSLLAGTFQPQTWLSSSGEIEL